MSKNETVLCPFCLHNYPEQLSYSQLSYDQDREVQVSCLECGAKGPLRNSKDEALYAWKKAMTGDKSCKNCLYWGNDAAEVCALLRPQEDNATTSEAGPHIKGDASDDSGLWAELCTGPDFYCNGHKPR